MMVNIALVLLLAVLIVEFTISLSSKSPTESRVPHDQEVCEEELTDIAINYCGLSPDMLILFRDVYSDETIENALNSLIARKILQIVILEDGSTQFIYNTPHDGEED